LAKKFWGGARKTTFLALGKKKKGVFKDLKEKGTGTLSGEKIRRIKNTVSRSTWRKELRDRGPSWEGHLKKKAFKKKTRYGARRKKIKEQVRDYKAEGWCCWAQKSEGKKACSKKNGKVRGGGWGSDKETDS